MGKKEILEKGLKEDVMTEMDTEMIMENLRNKKRQRKQEEKEEMKRCRERGQEPPKKRKRRWKIEIANKRELNLDKNDDNRGNLKKRRKIEIKSVKAVPKQVESDQERKEKFLPN